MKAKELINLSDNELSVKLRETKNEMTQLKFQHRLTPVKNPLKIGDLRRDIARILTIMNARKRKEVIK